MSSMLQNLSPDTWLLLGMSSMLQNLSLTRGYLLGMSSMLQNLSPDTWLSAGYELHAAEPVS
jgi:hypothetical protein